jgi:hypothetical protein
MQCSCSFVTWSTNINHVCVSSLQGRFAGHVHVGDHGDLIKETDLGGLSSALFTPNASQQASANAAAKHSGEHLRGSLEWDKERINSPKGEFSGEWALGSSGAGGGFMQGGGGGAGGAPSIFQRSSPTKAAGPGLAGGGDMPWGAAGTRRQPHPALAPVSVAPLPPPPPEASEGIEDLVLAPGDAGRAGGTQRQIQSARPVTRNGQELDTSVWERTIALQVCGKNNTWRGTSYELIRPGTPFPCSSQHLSVCPIRAHCSLPSLSLSAPCL